MISILCNRYQNYGGVRCILCLRKTINAVCFFAFSYCICCIEDKNNRQTVSLSAIVQCQLICNFKAKIDAYSEHNKAIRQSSPLSNSVIILPYRTTYLRRRLHILLSIDMTFHLSNNNHWRGLRSA